MNACDMSDPRDYLLRMWIRVAQDIGRNRRCVVYGEIVFPDHMWGFSDHFCAKELTKAITLARRLDAATFAAIDPIEAEQDLLSRMSVDVEQVQGFFLDPTLNESYDNIQVGKRSKFVSGAFEKHAPNAFANLTKSQKNIVEFVGRSGYLIDVVPTGQYGELLCHPCIANGGDYASPGVFSRSLPSPDKRR